MLGMMQVENGRGQSDWPTGLIARWNRRSRVRTMSFMSGGETMDERVERDSILSPESQRNEGFRRTNVRSFSALNSVVSLRDSACSVSSEEARPIVGYIAQGVRLSTPLGGPEPLGSSRWFPTTDPGFALDTSGRPGQGEERGGIWGSALVLPIRHSRRTAFCVVSASTNDELAQTPTSDTVPLQRRESRKMGKQRTYLSVTLDGRRKRKVPI